MRDFVSHVLLVAVSGFLLYHFIMIWKLGRFYIQEPNTTILTGEIASVVAILAYGIYMGIRWLRK